MQAELVSQTGDSVGQTELPDSVFGIRPNHHAIYEAVRAYLANRRQGTASTKGRSEVAYSGRKPWRQKGTGRARAGTRRSPLWVGGGGHGSDSSAVDRCSAADISMPVGSD